MINKNFIKLYEESFKQNWDLKALCNYGESHQYTYGDLAKEIAKLHLLFEECHLRRGDKIALIGKNTSNWCIAYLATVTYGAIVVPILPDFNPNDVHHIVNHSESVLFFSSDSIWESLEEDKMNDIRGVFSLTNFKLLHQRDGEQFTSILADLDSNFDKKYPTGFDKNSVSYTDLENDKIIVLNYTSGTTGFSKGVMITCGNLVGNIMFAKQKFGLYPGDKMLSILPLAHTYGCAFEFLYTIASGCDVTLLGKIPSPKILMKAFEEVRPKLVITVPLILEKIYKKMVLPILGKKTMRWALNIPLLDNQIYSQIRKKLIDAMGGRFGQAIIGGAPLNAEVEDFLHKIKFPFSVGYGMTECAPLISFELYPDYVPHSCGKVLDNMEVRIDSPDPQNIAGEIQTRGENVMVGYYKNEEATKEAFTEDGWLKTGDLGTLDAENNVFIRGRLKSMILGANGQNIYPEEIEAKLNNLPFVMESLVVESHGKLIALVYPDYEAVDGTAITANHLPAIMEENKSTLNNMVAAYERIAEIRLFPAEFEKTPKKSIKRFLYSNI